MQKINSPSYGFVTVNGYAVNIFYNPNCITDTNYDNLKAPDYACFNAIYDMNGLKNPNQVGKDIGFVTVIYPNETNIAVAPNPAPNVISGTKTWINAQKSCSNLGKEYALPSKHELLSIVINRNLIDLNLSNGFYWSSSSRSGNIVWGYNWASGNSSYDGINQSKYVLCIKK